jgi:polar amino acid transport system substrate-binding protein
VTRSGPGWLFAGCLAAASAACGGADDPGAALERLRNTGVVRIGYANEAPYAYRDTATGRVTGEAPEIARVVFERMGIETVEGVLTEFGSLIPGLQAGRFDVIAAGMYVTPERCTQVAFSQPTYGVGEGFIVREGNPLDLHRYRDVREAPAATLGVVSGAIESQYARAVGIPDDRVITFPDSLAALAGVRAGRVSAYAATALTVQNLLSKDSTGVEQALPFQDPVIDGVTVKGYGALAVRQADQALLAEIDRQLAGFIGTPGHLDLVAPFGFTAMQLPGTVTTAELCRPG